MKKTIVQLLSCLLIFGILSGCGTENAAESMSVDTAPPAVEETVQASPAVETPQVVSAVESSVETDEPSAQETESAVEQPEQSMDMLFTDYLEEPDVQSMYAEVADKFEQREYTDAETGLTIPYNLFVPEQAASEACPMVMFISDSSVVGRDLTAPLQQGYGGIIWATESEQQKHPSYVLVPQYSQIVIDDNNGENVSDYVEATARMVQAVSEENNVDSNRIYATGQSMGCMTSLYLASAHPDLFAAELFVSGQWKVEDLQNLGTQKFFYVAAGGDPKASAGQAAVLEDLEAKEIPVSTSYDWDANWTDAEYEPVLKAMLEEGNDIHIGQFAAGTVMEANPGRGIEHMSSFDCAYKIDAIRNWLFMQSK